MYTKLSFINIRRNLFIKKIIIVEAQERQNNNGHKLKYLLFY
jgi:hypothetical protein